MGEPIAVSIAECARLLSVTRNHAYHLIKTDPTFPRPFKVGGCTRILRAELEEWLANKAKQAREMQVARQSGRLQRREAVRMVQTSGRNAIAATPASLAPLVQHEGLRSGLLRNIRLGSNSVIQWLASWSRTISRAVEALAGIGPLFHVASSHLYRMMLLIDRRERPA